MSQAQEQTAQTVDPATIRRAIGGRDEATDVGTDHDVSASAWQVAGLLYIQRHELRRYLRIKRMGTSPGLVGESITPQGNTLALGRTKEQRRKEHEEAGVSPGRPMDPRMSNLRPGDQAG